MPVVMRFNQILPGFDPKLMAARHQAMLEMASYADDKGFFGVSLEEHHGAENGWSPSPMMLAAMMMARTKHLHASISALLLPLHDPMRVAEDLAVLDLASGGRVSTIAGIGYRPEEYAAHGKDWATRGALMDECVEVLLRAWTGEPFAYRGTTVRVTPRPLSQPHPTFMLGGTSKIAVRRAARYGLMFFAAAHSPELETYYYEQCKAFGTQGFFMAAAAETTMIHVADDPDRIWAVFGHCFLHEAATYAGWQTPDIRSAVHSHASTVEDLRLEGIYQVITPAECATRAEAQRADKNFLLHPLCGGMPIDEAWKSIELFTSAVLGR